MVGLVLLITMLDFSLEILFTSILGWPIIFTLCMLFNKVYKEQLTNTSIEQRRWLAFRLIADFALIIILDLPILFTQLTFKSLFTSTLIILATIYVYLIIRDRYNMNDKQHKEFYWNKNIDEVFFSFI